MGMFFELSNPGSVLPGVVGGICLLLGFYALGTLPVNYAGLLLMGFALLLFVVDVFAPTHGVLTVGGLIAFVLGSLLLFNVPEAAPWLGLSLWTILGGHGRDGRLLPARRATGGAVARAEAGRRAGGADRAGRAGAGRALEPDGMVWVDGALWEATVEGGPVPTGERVEVIGVDGLHLTRRGCRG